MITKNELPESVKLKQKEKQKLINKMNMDKLREVGTYITLDNGEKVLYLPMGVRVHKIEQNPFTEEIQYPGSEFIMPSIRGIILED